MMGKQRGEAGAQPHQGPERGVCGGSGGAPQAPTWRVRLTESERRERKAKLRRGWGPKGCSGLSTEGWGGPRGLSAGPGMQPVP